MKKIINNENFLAVLRPNDIFSVSLEKALLLGIELV